MSNSIRDPKELLPVVLEAFNKGIEGLKKAGISYVVTCTYRTREQQQELYEQGRTKPGPKVTNARPGESLHQYRCAFDIYPIVNSKIDLAGAYKNVWKSMADIFKAEGFEWGYDWKSFKEKPHFQMTKGHPLSYFQNGGTI
jgi:peptidoglycan L-alanyl-D-glutamate endopeptidase CwlK